MMRPTRWSILLALALAAGGVSYLVVRAYYSTMQSPTVYQALWLVLLAIVETYLALSTRARLAGRHQTRPINPLVVARFVALAKASSIVGAIGVGAYAGFLGWVVQIDSPDASRDTTTSAVGMGCSIALVLAALLLERVCRVPRRDDDTGRGGE